MVGGAVLGGTGTRVDGDRQQIAQGLGELRQQRLPMQVSRNLRKAGDELLNSHRACVGMFVSGRSTVPCGNTLHATVAMIPLTRAQYLDMLAEDRFSTFLMKLLYATPG